MGSVADAEELVDRWFDKNYDPTKADLRQILACARETDIDPRFVEKNFEVWKMIYDSNHPKAT